MINVYKLGGSWATSTGTKYSVKTTNNPDRYLSSGWSLSLDDIAIEGEFKEVNKSSKKRTKLAKVVSDAVDN